MLKLMTLNRARPLQFYRAMVRVYKKRGAAKYWRVLKVRLKNEGSELTTNCRQLKMTAEDGKKR